MRWLFRITLGLIFVGLLLAALMPYLPTLRMELSAFVGAWEEARGDETGEVTPLPEAPAPVVDNAETQRRNVALPIDMIAEPSDEDPLIIEARRRAAEDPEAAMNWLQNQPGGPLRLRGMLEVVALWATEDSEGALLWLESNAQGVARLETLNSGIELWAEQDPLAAATWIDGMANDGSKVTAIRALASSWASSSPQDAVAWINQLPDGALRNEAAAALVDSWSIINPQDAAIWAYSEAEFNGNQALFLDSIAKYAEQSPEEAEAFLRDIPRLDRPTKTIEAYVRARAKASPAEMMVWQSQLSTEDPLNHSDNARFIMQEWSRTDSVAASTWLSNQASGAQRDAAILGFSDSMLEFEPEAATAWANYISEPEARITQLTESVRTWARTKPQEALDWVSSADLTPELRSALAAEIGAD